MGEQQMTRFHYDGASEQLAIMEGKETLLISIQKNSFKAILKVLTDQCVDGWLRCPAKVASINDKSSLDEKYLMMQIDTVIFDTEPEGLCIEFFGGNTFICKYELHSAKGITTTDL